MRYLILLTSMLWSEVSQAEALRRRGLEQGFENVTLSAFPSMSRPHSSRSRCQCFWRAAAKIEEQVCVEKQFLCIQLDSTAQGRRATYIQNASSIPAKQACCTVAMELEPLRKQMVEGTCRDLAFTLATFREIRSRVCFLNPQHQTSEPWPTRRALVDAEQQRS